MYQLILASESPRRKQLLENAGFSFTTLPSKVSEFPNKNLTVNEQILDIARRKARFVFDQKFDSGTADLTAATSAPFVVLAADTMVVLNGKTLGKPCDENEAFEFLSALSGRTHQVSTGIVMLESNRGLELSHLETTDVEFLPLTAEQIKNYISTGEPLDKAGAYGIQGEARKFVKSYRGSFDNVVGLPVDVVKRMFEKLEGS